jgi:hypothetical protein
VRKETEDGEVEGATLPMEELPDKIVETIKGFHSHCRYFMVRPSLSPLLTPPSPLGSDNARH